MTEILTEAPTQKDSSPNNSGLNMEKSMVKVAMLSMTSRNWSILGNGSVTCLRPWTHASF